MTKIVCRSRSRCISFDHCSGTVKATRTARIVRMTIRPASVKPASDRKSRVAGRGSDSPATCVLRPATLQIAVRDMIERLARRLRLHVNDAGALVGGVGSVRVGGLVLIERVVLNRVPIGLLGDRVQWELSQVVGDELVEVVRIALFVGVE